MLFDASLGELREGLPAGALLGDGLDAGGKEHRAGELDGLGRQVVFRGPPGFASLCVDLREFMTP